MGKYTKNQLQKDIELLNKKLERLNVPQRLSCEGRNNYRAIDIYEGKTCLRNLACGTPRECLAAAQDFVLRYV
jgi:hypothetical protein